MKSIVYATVLVLSLSIGSFAQGRGGGRVGGLPEIPNRAEPAVNRPSSPGSERGNSSDRSATAREEARKDEAKKARQRDVAKQVTDNPGLTSAVKKLFPEDTDVGAMADGFDSVGQFVSAVHVSRNLEIPWDDLKTRIVTDDASLGEAIHALKPELTSKEVKSETKKAEEQAKKDIAGNKTS
jgi:hypothetical protein